MRFSAYFPIRTSKTLFSFYPTTDTVTHKNTLSHTGTQKKTKLLTLLIDHFLFIWVKVDIILLHYVAKPFRASYGGSYEDS